ncbi:hypothetical protein nbrc107696_28580 [Gordonia spumicola]|uniref:Uncharacterized protein n=1 Tax=Gordonia spumicola TaxID=589161 RepID=A0A7I9VAY3_9ACTN|nr:hypothetical protein [Gordonia spumicola]GEE02412.1 hypothetical protein nbrc107696_28580 [Gordonia spumicola]
MTGAARLAGAVRTAGTAALGTAAVLAVLAWTPDGRGEAILWAALVVATGAGLLALTVGVRALDKHAGPITRALDEIKTERAAERELVAAQRVTADHHEGEAR